MTETEYLLTYQYKYQVNKGLEDRKMSIRGLLVDPVTNSQKKNIIRIKR